MVKENDTIINTNNSYVINAGLAGNGPYRTVYEFEKNLPLSEWPNLITLEFSVNSVFDWAAAKNIDVLIHFINMKYIHKSIPVPSYLVIDLWFASSYYERKSLLYYNNITGYNPYENVTLNYMNPNITMLTPSAIDMQATMRMFNRGSPSTAYITSLCRFYGYPMISTAEALFPAFTRYYATHYSDDHHFRYTKDGTHLTAVGSELLISKIIKPFLYAELNRKQMTDTRHMNNTEYNYDVRMFPISEYPEFNILNEWRVWGTSVDSISNILLPGNKWTKISLRNHQDNLHNCYGSSNKDDKLIVSIPIHRRANCNSCRVQFGYLHSWNTTYIGGAKCTIYERDPIDESYKDHNYYHIEGHVHAGKKIIDSTVRIHMMPQILHYNDSKNHEDQFYIFECTNTSPNNERLLSCITSISLFSETE